MKSGTVVNARTGMPVASSIRLADGFFGRLRGLVGISGQRQAGMWLIPCTSVHTIGMRFPIDVVFLDRRGMVRKIDVAVRPFRVRRAVRSTYSVLELPAGYTRRVQLRVGDLLSFRHDSEPETARMP